LTSELGEYLRARRALVEPGDLGLPPGEERRVPGLRREEVAEAAAISLEYYIRLEQGLHQTPSEPVLKGLARALLLDDAAEAYLRKLVHRSMSAPTDVPRRDIAPQDLLALLRAWPHLPAGVLDRNMDLVAKNEMLDRVTAEALGIGDNVVEFIFSPEFKAYAIDWERLAAATVAGLRFGGDPADARFKRVVGSLLVRDRDFRRIWARHDAAPWAMGRTTHDIAPLGAVELTFQTFELPGTGGYHLAILVPDPGSPAETRISEIAEECRARNEKEADASVE
jgi:transcriptional regulator with XRE-family HTH domain